MGFNGFAKSASCRICALSVFVVLLWWEFFQRIAFGVRKALALRVYSLQERAVALIYYIRV